MSSLTERIAAAKAAGIVAKPQPEVVSKAAASHANAIADNQATGMASAISTHMNSRAMQWRPRHADDNEVDVEKADKAIAVYKNIGNLKRFMTANGTKIAAENDFYYPGTQEEVEILEDFMKRKLVKKVTPADIS